MNILKKIITLIKKWLGIYKEPISRYQEWENETHKHHTLINEREFIGPSHYSKQAHFEDKSLKGSDPIFDIAEFVFSKLITGAGAAAWNSFYTDVIKGGVTELTQILQKLESIEAKLSELMALYKNTTFETYINERSKYVSDLTTAQTYYLQQLQNLSSDDEKAKRILKDWSKSYISGNSAMVQYQNFINFVLDTRILTQYTLYDVYDIYVYNTTPFEHMGYNYRQSLRDMDFAAIATNAILSMLFIKSNPDIDETVRASQIKTVADKLKQYYDYYTKHKVVRQDNKVICQIDKTHFEMDKQLWTKDMKNHSWMKNGTIWDREHCESSWCLLWGDDQGRIPGDNCGRELYLAEYNRIINYYNGSGKTFFDILFNEMKCVKPYYNLDLDKAVMPLACGTYENGNKQYFYETVRNNNNNVSQEYVGEIKIEHTGFLWLIETFRGWNYYNDNNKWMFSNITWRNPDNWKE